MKKECNSNILMFKENEINNSYNYLYKFKDEIKKHNILWSDSE